MSGTDARRHVGPGEAVRHCAVLCGRGLRKIRRNPEHLVDVTVQPVLFLVMFGFLFGGAIAGDTTSYLRNLVPGLLVPTVLLASMSAGVGLNIDVDQGVFDRFRSMPIARAAPLVGGVLADVVRYLLAFGTVLAVGTAMGFRVHTGLFATLAAAGLLVAAGLCFCWVTVYIGMVVRRPDSVQGVAIALFMPFVFASNVFVPSASMPGWLRAWSGVNPVSLLADVMRGLLAGGPVAGPLAGGLVWMVVAVLVFFPLAMRAYRKRAG
ncbi:ABC transporter permease [Amycolatopsis sp. NPDC059027]|uniref:ABC transporter permease n=1 Tax=unclassified Amycolatopsis TaxID=2618356 RepID=UPI00366D4FDF